MAKLNRTILFISYVIVGLLTEGFIFYLFPFTGLGGLICYPTSVIISLIFGWCIYKITKKQVKPIFIGLISFSFLTIQFFIELTFHPQDFGGSPFSQLNSFSKAVKNYDNINYTGFSNLNQADRVVFIYKFKNKLPQSISTLYIDNSDIKSEYDFYNYPNGKIVYDTTKLKLLYTDTSLVIIQNPNSKNFIELSVADKTLLNNDAGGYSEMGSSIFYNVAKDSFQLNSGIQKLFYKYLSWTKKASR